MNYKNSIVFGTVEISAVPFVIKNEIKRGKTKWKLLQKLLLVSVELEQLRVFSGSELVRSILFKEERTKISKDKMMGLIL